MQTIEYKGLQAYCTAYVMNDMEYGLVYMSLVGPRQAVRGIQAALLNGYFVSGDLYFRRLNFGRYVSVSRRLPENECDHLLLIHEQGTVNLVPGFPFYVVADGEAEVVPFFERAFDRAFSLPILSGWGQYLWKMGVSRELIIPLECKGVKAWRVSGDEEQWKELVRVGIVRGKLG